MSFTCLQSSFQKMLVAHFLVFSQGLVEGKCWLSNPHANSGGPLNSWFLSLEEQEGVCEDGATLTVVTSSPTPTPNMVPRVLPFLAFFLASSTCTGVSSQHPNPSVSHPGSISNHGSHPHFSLSPGWGCPTCNNATDYRFLSTVFSASSLVGDPPLPRPPHTGKKNREGKTRACWNDETSRRSWPDLSS